MASSRKSKRSRRASSSLPAAVASSLKAVVKRGDRLLAGLSGGVDSIVLLDALAKAQKRMGFTLGALHVNHQLSPHAATWARFCRAVCRARGIPCRVVKVNVARGDSVEGSAREARYRVFRTSATDYVVLGHNADDQAETVLLQLLRGAGVRGLAAMPMVRSLGRSGCAKVRHAEVSILRPLLEIPRSAIEAYARRRKLEWIEDESNADPAYLRSWLRKEILPRIATRVPGYRTTLMRAARHFAEAKGLLDDLAYSDIGGRPSRALSLSRLRALPAARVKNVLRSAIAAEGWMLPQAGRLDEAVRQALTARGDARVCIDLGDCILRTHVGTLYLLADNGPPPQNVAVSWRGEREIPLPELGGVLAMMARRGAGLSVRRLRAGPVTVRGRSGGARLKTRADRPRRTVKNLLQEARLPPWERDCLPFIYCGDALVCIPGVAIDPAFAAGAGEPSIVPEWRTAVPRGDPA